MFNMFEGVHIISHHLRNHGKSLLLVFTGELSFQTFLGDAGFRPSTVFPLKFIAT